jgi:hypothetical protein
MTSVAVAHQPDRAAISGRSNRPGGRKPNRLRRPVAHNVDLGSQVAPVEPDDRILPNLQHRQDGMTSDSKNRHDLSRIDIEQKRRIVRHKQP